MNELFVQNLALRGAGLEAEAAILPALTPAFRPPIPPLPAAVVGGPVGLAALTRPDMTAGEPPAVSRAQASPEAETTVPAGDRAPESKPPPLVVTEPAAALAANRPEPPAGTGDQALASPPAIEPGPTSTTALTGPATPVVRADAPARLSTAQADVSRVAARPSEAVPSEAPSLTRVSPGKMAQRQTASSLITPAGPGQGSSIQAPEPPTSRPERPPQELATGRPVVSAQQALIATSAVEEQARPEAAQGQRGPEQPMVVVQPDHRSPARASVIEQRAKRPAASEAAEMGSVEVHIGQIEVRAEQARPSDPRQARSRPQPQGFDRFSELRGGEQ